MSTRNPTYPLSIDLESVKFRIQAVFDDVRDSILKQALCDSRLMHDVLGTRDVTEDDLVEFMEVLMPRVAEFAKAQMDLGVQDVIGNRDAGEHIERLMDATFEALNVDKVVH